MKGLRLTSQRRALLEIIESARPHPDAAGLLKLARERDASIDRATVYRTLDLVRRLGLVGGPDYIRLTCFHCGKTEEMESPLFEGLKKEIGLRRGFSIRAVRMEVAGNCSDCAPPAK